MAKKYIEAKEFWNRLISVSENDWVGFDTIDEILSEMPAADVVEVVRCKDCKHYQFADNRAFGMPVKMCEWFGFEDVDDDDFCSRAERRTDG